MSSIEQHPLAIEPGFNPPEAFWKLPVHKAYSTLEVLEIVRARRSLHALNNVVTDRLVSLADVQNHPIWAEIAANQTPRQHFRTAERHVGAKAIDVYYYELLGDWHLTKEGDVDLAELAEELRAEGRLAEAYDRDAPGANRRIVIEPAIITAEGLVAAHRKRKVLVTTPRQIETVDARTGKPLTLQVVSEVDKMSDFVIDLEGLSNLSPRAASEVRAVIRMDVAMPLKNGEANEALEFAIHEYDDDTLTTVMAQSFVENKYKNGESF